MIDVEIQKKAKGSRGSSSAGGGSYAYSDSTAEADYAQNAANAEHANNADEALHAQSSASLDGNSSVWTTIRNWLSDLSDLYLSKVNADTAQKLITFLEGTQIGKTFVSGILGEGGVFQKDADGKTYLETDKMYVRMKAYFDTVEIRRYMHSGGNRVASVAGAKIVRVEMLDDSGATTTETSACARYRCYFRGSDGDDTVTNDFVVGDEVRCHTTNVSKDSLSQKDYWRLVVGKSDSLNGDGEYYIDLSNKESETINNVAYSGYMVDSDAPSAQDDVFQLGNVNDTSRCGAIIEFVSGGGTAPSYQIFQNIGYISDTTAEVADKRKIQYSTDGCNYIDLGYNQQTGRAYMNVYGDAYIGDKDGSTYIKYDAASKKLSIRAGLDAKSTIDGKDVLTYIKEHSSDWSKDDINKLISDGTSGLRSSVEAIKKQADGAIETYYLNGKPTLANAPAKDWSDNGTKDTHIGDLYFDKATGYAYRFLKDDNGSYEWKLIHDSDITAALNAASNAQDTANGKRRIFVVQPTPPYDKGDLWVNATYPSGNTVTDDANHKYYNDILKCNTDSKHSGGSFEIADWNRSSKYTDDSALNKFMEQMKSVLGTDYLNKNYSYLLERLVKGSTEVNGGLVLTNMLGLKDSSGAVKAGINGLVNPNAGNSGLSTIAAWYGGQMTDLQSYDATSTGLHYVDKSSVPDNAAKTLFRMDGSGYIATGNISWDETGRINVRNLYFGSNKIDSTLSLITKAFSYRTTGFNDNTQVAITPNGPFTSLYVGNTESDKKKVLTVGDDSVTWWGQRMSGSKVSGSITVGEDDGTFVQIGAIRLVYDATNNAIKVVKSDGTSAANLYAVGGISALGVSSTNSSSSGASALSQLSDVVLSSPFLSGQSLVYDGTNWVNKSITIAVDSALSKTSTNPVQNKAITEKLNSLESSIAKNIGGSVLADRFGTDDFETSFRSALAYAKENGFSVVDASWFSGTWKCAKRFTIDFPVTIRLGNVTLNMEDTIFFDIESNNVRIEGVNRQTDARATDQNATLLVLKGVSTTSSEGYHIYSRGRKNCQYRNMVLKGTRTSTGRQCDNTSYPIDGTGGIYIEKGNPGTTSSGNTCNATIIENLLIDGTKAHGIYMDTPILSEIRNVRISNAGGHGLFISGGTTLMLDNVYVASARYAGICLSGVTYCAVLNSVSENCGCGWWIRSCFNVSLFSPGVENTYNLGNNPWSKSYTVTKRYGMNIKTTSSSGETVKIADVPDEDWEIGSTSYHARRLFAGYAFVVTGGRNIDIYSPYATGIAKDVESKNPRLDDVKNRLCYMLIMGNSRAVKISNAGFHESNGSNIPSAIKYEIKIGAEAKGTDLSYDPDNTVMESYTAMTPVTSNESLTAPVLCLSTSAIVHSGNRIYTEITNATERPIYFVVSIESAEEKSVTIHVQYISKYEVTEGGIAYSSTSKMPTISQNKKSVDTSSIKSAGGGRYTYDVQMPRSSSSETRYVRAYLNVRATSDSQQEIYYDTSTFKVTGSAIELVEN